jgi:hypothetical protein
LAEASLVGGKFFTDI